MINKKPFNKETIERIPEHSPQGYQLFDISGELLYVGITKRWRIRERLLEHKNNFRFQKVSYFATEEFSSIEDAREWEEKKIEQANPKLNKQG